MSDVACHKLAEIVARYGRDLGDDPRRCEALLRDVCGQQYKREIFVLVSAARERVPAQLQQSSSGVPAEVVLLRLIQHLHDNLGLSEDLARWAVESWAFALGAAGLGHAKRRPVGSSAPPSTPLPSSKMGSPSATPRADGGRTARTMTIGNVENDCPDDLGKAGDASLRPETLDDYVGQAVVRRNLDIAIRAALARGESPDHMLLVGPPGLGKTSLAYIVSRMMGGRLHPTSGPEIESAGDLAAILTSLERGDVLFIDEIHRLGKAIEEILYPAMEDFRLDLEIGEGPSARHISLSLARFTLVGETTRPDMLSAPLRSRFGYAYTLELYSQDELAEIVRRSARRLSVAIDTEASAVVAAGSRGTPRIANRLLRRLRDYAQVKGYGDVTAEVAAAGLDFLGLG